MSSSYYTNESNCILNSRLNLIVMVQGKGCREGEYIQPLKTKKGGGVWKRFSYSESQIYEYIARVFYNVVFSTYLISNAAEKLV